MTLVIHSGDILSPLFDSVAMLARLARSSSRRLTALARAPIAGGVGICGGPSQQGLLQPLLPRGESLARHLCQAPASTGPSTASSGAAAAVFAPSYSRSARRARLKQALAQAASGGEFVVPAPETRSMPGPCGAVMNVLSEGGPLKTSELYEAVEKKYPGVVVSKTHLKEHILKRALVNKLVKVQLDDSKFKDRWAVRRPGQVRMKIARTLHDP